MGLQLMVHRARRDADRPVRLGSVTVYCECPLEGGAGGHALAVVGLAVGIQQWRGEAGFPMATRLNGVPSLVGSALGGC